MASSIVTKYGKSFTMLPNTFVMNPNISSDAKVLMLILQQYAWTSNEVFPAVDTILYHLNWGRTRYNSARKELIDKGFIEVKQQNTSGCFSHNIYTLDPEHIYEPSNDTSTNQLTSVDTLSDNGLSVNVQRTLNNTNIYNNTNNINNNINNGEQPKNKVKDLFKSTKPPYNEIIDYLNEKANKHYKPNSKQTVKLINERWAEGYTLDDFKTVIDNKCIEWLNNAEFNQYLRPETLFSTKFESYLNSKPIPFKNTSNTTYHFDGEDTSNSYNTNSTRRK